MTHKLGSQLLSLPQIFDGHTFAVPDYQRGYAWEASQVKDLLEDVDHLMLNAMDGRHFTGTLVINKVPGSDRLDIVDGQQRLTTLVILMRCIHAAVKNAEIERFISERYLKRGKIGNEYLVLQVGTDCREFFERVVLGNDSTEQVQRTLAAHENLYAARSTIEAWLKPKPEGFAARALVVLEQRLGMLVYSPAESSEIGIMFEVINNRGKDLSELEKVKNYLIYVATKLNASSTRDKVNNRWSSILRNLHIAKFTSADDEKSFLRAVSILHFSFNKSDSGYVYDMLRQKFLKTDVVMATEESRLAAIKQIESFVELLGNASHWYAVLYGEQHGDLHPDVSAVLDRIYAQAQHANIMPVFLAVMIHQAGHDKALVRLLELIEKINFRVYVAPGVTKRTDTGQGELYSIASSYYNRAIVFETPLDQPEFSENYELQLEHALVGFGLRHVSDQVLLQSLELSKDDAVYDYYTWPGLKYFLICYEASLKKSKTVKLGQIVKARSSMKSGDYYSVEHIWATKHQPEVYCRPKDSHVRRRLGNFVLLELNLNIAGSNHDIQTKIGIYSGQRIDSYADASGSTQPTEMAQVREMIGDAKKALNQIRQDDFEDGRRKPYFDVHKTICDSREERFRKFVASQWTLKNNHGYKQALAAIDYESSKDD
jgi:hypothetical protein